MSLWRAAVISLLAGTTMLAPAAASSSTVSPVILTSSRTSTRVVALTFDDGPSPYTDQILAVLQRFHVRATFFVVGVHVATGADALRAEAKGGNVIGNHTYSHSDLVALGDPAIVEELTRTQQAVAAASGVTPHWFRPPYGAIDARVANIAASLGLHSVTWSVDPRDWTRPGVSAIVGRVVSAVQPGSIVELHDGGGDRSETVAAITILIPLLLARGYRFVTLDEMFFPHESLSTPPKPRRMCIRRVANDRCVWFAWVRP